MESFIIGMGEMWGQIHEILRRKAAAGLDVRVIYDDAGCLSLLPHNYAEMMRADGIRAFSFNRCVPVLNLVMNNRDHRKIMVIDGQIAFTGGVNLADEYINKIVRFGYWKDSGVRLNGPGAASLANIFLTFWKAKYPDEDLDAGCDLPAAVPVETDCLVQPFADTPVDREAVAKNVYLELINQAQKRLYICTPYLILDNDLLSCLRLAAKRGVDVRIYTPGVPDKPTIYQLTRSYFPHLLRAGVKIYSYTPGFLHAKTWLVDDRIAAVGTVNLDYRSLYLHFENSVLALRRRGAGRCAARSGGDRKGKCRGDAGGLPDRIFWHAVQRGAAAGGTVVLKAGGVPDDTGASADANGHGAVKTAPYKAPVYGRP
ncbi:MAG: phospholipase D-like domain-containing protein [Gemmiger formicilis]